MTAVLVGLKSRGTALSVQRFINEYPGEPLTAILPGVALLEVWEIVGTVERTLLAVSVLVVVVGLAGTGDPKSASEAVSTETPSGGGPGAKESGARLTAPRVVQATGDVSRRYAITGDGDPRAGKADHGRWSPVAPHPPPAPCHWARRSQICCKKWRGRRDSNSRPPA